MDKKKFDNKDFDPNTPIPYILYEGIQYLHHKTVKKLVIALIIAVALMFASNAVWLIAWMQYDYVGSEDTITYAQDGSRFNNINTGEQGDISWPND